MFLKLELCWRPDAANPLGASSTFLWSEQTWKLFRSTPSRSRSLAPLSAVLEKAAIRRRAISETALRMLLLGLRSSHSSQRRQILACPTYHPIQAQSTNPTLSLLTPI